MKLMCKWKLRCQQSTSTTYQYWQGHYLMSLSVPRAPPQSKLLLCLSKPWPWRINVSTETNILYGSKLQKVEALRKPSRTIGRYLTWLWCMFCTSERLVDEKRSFLKKLPQRKHHVCINCANQAWKWLLVRVFVKFAIKKTQKPEIPLPMSQVWSCICRRTCVRMQKRVRSRSCIWFVAWLSRTPRYLKNQRS